MIDLFTKIDKYIDYNNQYTIRKALTTLNREFEISMSRKNITHAQSVIDTIKKIYDKLSLTYRESEDLGETMSYSQKLMAQKIRRFIGYLIKRLKYDFGVGNYEQEIEQTIN
jgi:hypothetical protein